MEASNVEGADSVTSAAANVSCRDEDDYSSQKKMLPETKFLSSDHLASMDTTSSPRKEASSDESLFKLFLGKSPKLKTPVKNHKGHPVKSTRRLFMSPSKRKEMKTCTLKRHKSSEISSDEVDVKRKKRQYNRSDKGQLNMQDEVIATLDDNGINESLENKATKANLSATNVKSMIHHVLTNDQVLKMFKDVLESDQQDTQGQSSPKKIDVAASRFVSLPTMTRARVREFLEKISMPSPIKAPREGPSIMDVEFNEEDDDDEYNPEKDEECHESDDESITSSKLSEFGSPYRDFACTSFMTPSRDTVVPECNTVTKDVASDTIAEPDLPTTSMSGFENVLVIETEATEEEATDGIACRTRSKLPLTSTSITEIESAFVAPDITTDMYHNYCDDANFAQFLSSLYKTTDDAATDDDADANDPDFNYISEAEREQVDEEDFRFDKPTKVTKKELSVLFEELSEYFGDEVLPYQVVASASEATGMQPGGQNIFSSSPVKAARVSLPVPTTPSSFTYTSDSQQPEPSSSQHPEPSCSKFKTPHPPPPPHLAHIASSNSEPIQPSHQPSTFTDPSKNSVSNADTAAVVTPEQRALIEDNIRKHIQLLLQSYMLSQNSTSLVQETADSKSMIEEVNYLCQSFGETSPFNVCNLDPAVELLSQPAVVENNRTGPVWTLSQTQKLAIINSPAFIYPHLLPVLAKPKPSERKYNRFFRSEDNLIALGLEQFRKCKGVNPVELIHQLLIRGKTLEQVFYRVQYMSSGKVGDNPIKEVKKTGRLPITFPKPTVDYFYTVAPKDHMSDLLPAWCSNTLSTCKVQSETNTNLSQPGFIRQLSQREVSGMSNLSTKPPHERVDNMRQTAHPQIQPLVNIPAVTFQAAPSVQLPTGLPPIAGIYIQFSAPTAVGPPISPVVTFPSLITSTSAEHESTSRGSHNRKITKRRITLPSSTSRFKKQRVQASAVNEAAVSDTSNEGHLGESPDLLAKTMLSCGIQECQVCPSPHTQLQYSHHVEQMGVPFTSSTPVAQDKHPSVRNLSWEFDAAHRQSVHNIPVPQTHNTKETYDAQSKSSCSQISTCQTVVSQNETTATTELRSCVMSPLHHHEPDVNGEPRKEEARISKDSDENLIPYTNSTSVSKHDLLGDISKRTTASTGSDFNDSFGETSQSIFSSDLPLTSEMVESKKQSPTIVGDNNSQKYELSRDNQKFSDLSPQSHLLTDITFQSQTENVDIVDSGLALDCTNQNDNGTCKTVQVDQSAQSGINLSVQNDKVSLNNATEACEIAQDDRSAQSGINWSVKNDKVSLNNATEACEIAQDDRSAQSGINWSVQNDKVSLNNVTEACEIAQDDRSAQSGINWSVQNDKVSLNNVTEACEIAQDDRSAQSGINWSVQNDKVSLNNVTEACEIAQDDRSAQSGTNLSVKDDKEELNNVTETNSTHAADVLLPVLTDDSSSSIDKTLTRDSENISDRSNSYVSNNSEPQTQLKPKTIRQILKASEKNKPHTTISTSVLTSDDNCVTSDIVNQNTDTIIRATDNTNINKPTQGIILRNDNSESSSCAQQTSTAPASLFSCVTKPTTKSVVLIGRQSPVKNSDPSNISKLSSPFKTPTKLRPLMPKTPSSAGSSSSPYVSLPKTSPKRKELNKHVRQILPKSFVFEIKSPSPTKTAAQVLKKRATLFCQNRSPVKLLPKQPQTALSGSPRSKPLLTPARMFTRSQKTRGKNPGKKSCQESAVPVVKDPQPNKDKATVEPAVIETEDAVLSQEEEEEDFESDDQSQLDDLMAACTTIGYDPKKGNSGVDTDNKSKAQKKKDVCLSMLEPDIIDRDSKKDERDTAYAQHYFTNIKQMLSDDAERFKKFLTILHDMNRNHMNPVELYADMATLLSRHQDLVDDFAGFLLSFQAVECNCFVSYLEYQQILTFLRRLEIYCDSSNLTYQRTLKMMSRWLIMLNQEAQTDTTPFKEKIAAVLRHVPNIMDDLQSYFFGSSLPDSHPDDFEEVNLDEEAMTDVDEFEEITLPEGREDYNTKLCSCQCHQDQQDEKLRRRIRHCYSCSLKIFDGKPVLKTSRNEYRPITVLYPLEEKEKMMRAKKEAAQLALAKARAQRQLKKRAGKKKNIGSLKSKNSKNIPLKKKFKRRKRCKPQSNSTDVGNIGMPVTETESKISNVQDDVSTSTQKQETSDLKSTSSKPSDDHYKTSSGKLTEVSADVSGSPSTAKTSTDSENSGTQFTFSTTKSSEIATISEVPAETAVLAVSENKLDSDPSMSKHDDVDKSGMTNVEPHFNAELLNSRLVPMSASSLKSTTPLSDSCESRQSSVTTVASTVSLGHCVAGNDVKNNNQQPQMSTSQLNISQTQVLSKPALPVSCTSSTLTLSQINSLDSPVASISQISADRLNVSRADSPLNKIIVSSQNTQVLPFGLQPRFAASPMVTSARIPVLVTIAPQQYLSPANSVAGKPRQKTPQMSGVTTSVFSPQHIRSTKANGKYGSHGTETNPSHNVIYSNPTCTQTLTSSSSSRKSSFPGSALTTDAYIVPQTGGCPASTVSDAIISSNSVSSFAKLPSSFMHSDNQTVSVSVLSGEKLVPAADLQLSDTICSLPSTPIKDQIPAAVVRAHLDNFSLGAFDASMGFSQLQQLMQSPSKLTDSVTKFDLLALIDSSNLGSKDFTLQSCMASSSTGAVAEPLLTFSGALEKLRAKSDSVVLAAQEAVCESQSISVPVTMENLPAIPDVTGQHDQPDCDYAIDDDRQSHFTKETEEDLQNLCPQLNPSNMLLDDESSNAFVLSAWTEEQDRSILNVVIPEGVTQETVKKLHSKIQAKSVEEINSRAGLLLQMLEQMGDTESDTDTDTSHFDPSEQAE